MTTRERITIYQESKELSDYRVEKDLGLSKGYMFKCKNPSSLMLEKFCRVYSDVSAEWLLRGNGPMIIEGNATINIDASHTNVTNDSGNVAIKGSVSAHDSSALENVVATLQKTIERQQAIIDKLIAKL